jgi:hypothetical protein
LKIDAFAQDQKVKIRFAIAISVQLFCSATIYWLEQGGIK